MQGLLALSNLFSKLSTFPEDQIGAHRVILDAVLASLGRAASGVLAVKQGTVWELSVSTGSMLHADLEREIDLALQGNTLRTSDHFMCGLLRTDRGVGIALRLQTDGKTPFNADDKVLFKVALDLVSAYETYNETKRTSKNAQESVKQILDLVSGLRDSEVRSNAFFLELLRSALSVVEEADYGSLALLSGERWTFVAAVGHGEGLGRLSLLPHEFGSFSEVAVIDDLLARTDILSPRAMAEIGAHSKPISRSLIVGLDVGPNYRVNLSLDIRKGSTKDFSANSKLAIDRFVRLASSYLRLSLQSEFVERSYRNFTDKLAILAEAHDRNTAMHNVRVSLLSGFLAEKLGLEPSRVQGVRKGAMLHDIGKIFIPSDLLNKKGRLTKEEWERMKEHTLLSEKLLDDPYFALDQKIAVYHHERYDGMGYPRGLKGDEIPVEAQIVSAADVYDALRDARPYKPSFSPQETLARMRFGDNQLAPGAFNPEILSILEEHWETIEQLWTRVVPDSEPAPAQEVFVF